MRVNSAFTKELEVTLTAEEFDSRATAFARCDEKLVALEAEKDHVVKGFKERLAEVEGERTRLRRIVLERKELREVSVRWDPHWPSNTVQLVRLDTHQVIESRTMTPAELQETLAYDVDDDAPDAPERNADVQEAEVTPATRQLGDGKRGKKRRAGKPEKHARA